VKFREILHRQQFSCVAETVAALLAGDLGLPHAEPVIVELNRNLAPTVPPKWKDYADRIERSEGLNFGSVFVGQGTNAALPSADDRPELLRFWAELFCFDFLIQNYDRVSDNPNYLWQGDRIILIDHEQAFSHIDSENEFSLESLALNPLFRHVAFLTLDLATDIRPFFQRLARLPDARVSSYFRVLPPVWGDRRSIRLEQYLLWAKVHSTALCEWLATILAV
ncbi:MAG: HipA family kinase, partial [Verrucomicrobiota bacterium]